MDLTAARNTAREQERIGHLMRMVPVKGARALDIGARDAYLSRLLADRFDRVVALDLEKPDIDHERIEPVKGNASHLEFDDNSFDLVLCAEVLEHIPTPLLPQVCREIARVTAGVAVIGVPNRQDLRHGRTVCQVCEKTNPAWGHVNVFDEQRLCQLFTDMTPVKIGFVGTTNEATNAVSAFLMDYAGHPYGTYAQEEVCIHCGNRLQPPPARSISQRLATRTAHVINQLQRRLTPPRGNWIHVKFDKARQAPLEARPMS